MRRLSLDIASWSLAANARLARTTVRERVLLGGLALSALVLAPVTALNVRANEEERFVEAQTAVDTARLDAATARRIQLAALDEAARRDLDAWGFRGTNLAVVRVRIEERIAAAAAEAGLTNVTVAAGDALEADGPTQWLRFDLEADLKWSPTFALLDMISAWPEGFRVLEFSFEGYQTAAPDAAPVAGYIIQAGPTARVSLALSFPVVVPEEAAPQ
ncbi:hypothetical protein [Brevundimonas sp. TWP2-3-4b1]|uniref:hypothetical protein n=1 Tax=Brevundimonas sp. TWP2-3-4b1 TaxID=2804580 RepID=UPI003CED8D55